MIVYVTQVPSINIIILFSYYSVFRRRRSVHMDQRTAVRLQGLREPVGPWAKDRERMVLVGHPGQDTGYQPDTSWLDLQSMEQEWAQEDTTAGQRWVRHQWHSGVVPERAQQRIRRWHCVARHWLLSREAVRVRRQRRATQLRGRHQPRPPTLNSVIATITKITILPFNHPSHHHPHLGISDHPLKIYNILIYIQRLYLILIDRALKIKIGSLIESSGDSLNYNNLIFNSMGALALNN